MGRQRAMDSTAADTTAADIRALDAVSYAVAHPMAVSVASTKNLMLGQNNGYGNPSANPRLPMG